MDSALALEKIYPKVLNFVSRQARTKKEVADRLKVYLKIFDLSFADKQSLLTALTSRLEEERFLDDKKYASDFVFVVINSSKPRGQGYIKRFLYKKGISQNLIELALKDIEPESELDAAVLVATKKLRQLTALNANVQKKKLWVHLYSRGFPSNIIGRVIDIVLGVT